MVEDVGEMELANQWREGKDKLKSLCAEDCGEGSPKEQRKRKKSSSSKSSAKKEPAPSANKPKAAATGLEELPPPPHKCLHFAKETFEDFLKDKAKFKLVLFYD